MGVTGIETSGINNNDDASLLRARMEFEADTALKYIKGYKNAVAYPEYDANGYLLKISIMPDTEEVIIME